MFSKRMVNVALGLLYSLNIEVYDKLHLYARENLKLNRYICKILLHLFSHYAKLVLAKITFLFYSHPEKRG